MTDSHTMHTKAITDASGRLKLLRRPLAITVIRGPDAKTRAELTEDRIVIGTHERCDLALTDPTISRQHLEVVLTRDGYLLRDLGSRNGTWVGGLRLGEAVVSERTRVRLGETELEMVPLDKEIELPLVVEDRWQELRGRSPAMRQVFERLAKVAPTDATVLLTGESGTGKEVAARSIHQASKRADRPFVVVDCGALAENLIESELYGHEKGAFTGATGRRDGAFVTAAGGTVFLDEIGELPLAMQTRLLGVLERRMVQPLGGTRSRPVDVRIVAATNRDLRRMVNEGSFRADLYFRLAVIQVALPPLRDRPEDIAVYVEAFLDEWADAGARVEVPTDLVTRLQQRSWPGNVRELRNVLERAVVLGELPSGDERPGTPSTRSTDDEAPAPSGGVSFAVDPEVPFKVAKAELVNQYERAYLEALMPTHAQNITRAARAAEIDRVYLLRLLDRHGLRPTRK